MHSNSMFSHNQEVVTVLLCSRIMVKVVSKIHGFKSDVQSQYLVMPAEQLPFLTCLAGSFRCIFGSSIICWFADLSGRSHPFSTLSLEMLPTMPSHRSSSQCSVSHSTFHQTRRFCAATSCRASSLTVLGVFGSSSRLCCLGSIEIVLFVHLIFPCLIGVKSFTGWYQSSLSRFVICKFQCELL